MKFQKTAIAVTIAGFAAMPTMASADTVLSGVIEVMLAGTDADDDPATPGDESIPLVAAGDVRVAVASEHELNSGLIGYGNIQMNLDNLTGEGGLNQSLQLPIFDPNGSLSDEDIVELTSAATVAADNVYVGVKGGFGDIRIGDIPLAIEYGQLANDIYDVGVTVPGGMSYTGAFGPVGFGLNYSPDRNSDLFGIGGSFNIAGVTVGLGFEDRADTARYAAGASFAIAGFSIAAHYWAGENNYDPSLVIDTGAEDGDNVDASGFSIDDTESFAVQVGYSIAGVALGVTYTEIEGEEQGASLTAPETTDQSIVRFDAGYNLGGDTTISTRIQNTMDDSTADAEDLLEYRVMLAKTF